MVGPRAHTVSKLVIPIGSAVLGLAAVLILLAKPILGSWKLAGTIALAMLIGVPILHPYFRREVPNPFSDPPKFSISDQEASQIFAQLHKNMFRAFDYRNESDIYDALAKSVDGELLRRLYLQINQSLKMKEQGGTVARIDEVTLMGGGQQPLELIPGDVGFMYRSRWNVTGTVEHWGHVHQRVNQYDAQFTLKLVDDNWKIVDLEMLDEFPPGIIKTTLRKF
jgi:hypothetical protein